MRDTPESVEKFQGLQERSGGSFGTRKWSSDGGDFELRDKESLETSDPSMFPLGSATLDQPGFCKEGNISYRPEKELQNVGDGC